jgi:hypothetical protein
MPHEKSPRLSRENTVGGGNRMSEVIVSRFLEEFYEEAVNRFYFHYRVASGPIGIERIVEELNRRIPLMGRSSISSLRLEEEKDRGLFRVSLNGGNNVFFQSVGKNLWLIFYGSDVQIGIRKSLKKLLDSIRWLVPTWIRPDEIEGFYGTYSSEFDIVKVYTIFDPYHLFKKLSRIPSEFQDSLREEWFYRRSIEVSVSAPKTYVKDVFAEVMRERLTEAIKARFALRFSNPGKSDIIIDENAEIVHEGGMLEATDRILNDVKSRTLKNLETYAKFLPVREYSLLGDGSYDLVEYQPSRSILFRLGPRAKYDIETSLRVMNMFTIGRKNLPVYGVQVSRDGLDFVCKSFLDFDRSSFFLGFSRGEDGSPTIKLEPFHLTSMGLIIIHKLLSEKIDWNTKLV